jgi:hypothetical protein
MGTRLRLAKTGAQIAALQLSSLVSGCPSEAASPQGPASPATAPSHVASRVVDAAASRAERPAPTKPGATKPLESDARALLASWEAAQNAGDFAAYERLYAKRFTGVKRSGPRTRSFARAGWLEDRKRMF